MTKPERRWLRYSLRTLLIVFTLIAVVLGIRLNQIHRQRQAIEAIRSLGGNVLYDDEAIGRSSQPGMASVLKEFLYIREPAWVRLSGKKIDDEVLRKYVVPLKSTKHLFMLNVSVTNEGLQQLGKFKSLKSVVCTRDPRHAGIFQILEEPTQVDFEDLPLEDAIRFLKDLHGIKIVLDKKSLSEAALNPKAPITAKLKGLVLGHLLSVLVNPKGMDWFIADGKVVVSTFEIAAKHHRIAEQLEVVLPERTSIRVD